MTFIFGEVANAASSYLATGYGEVYDVHTLARLCLRGTFDWGDYDVSVKVCGPLQ